MPKKCDLCQRPLDWKGGYDMYVHKPCNECKWGTNSCIPDLPDHFKPKENCKHKYELVRKPGLYRDYLIKECIYCKDQIQDTVVVNLNRSEI